eukprot:5521125-Amphidinium_carterae.2
MTKLLAARPVWIAFQKVDETVVLNALKWKISVLELSSYFESREGCNSASKSHMRLLQSPDSESNGHLLQCRHQASSSFEEDNFTHHCSAVGRAFRLSHFKASSPRTR